eukprot:g81434.t1
MCTSPQSCLHAYLVVGDVKTSVKRLPPWRCEVTGCDSVNFFTQSKCRACNALCTLFMAQPDPRNWAVSDVLAIHGAFKNSVDLLHIAEKGIGGILSMTGVFSAVNAGVRPGLLLRVEYDGKESNCIVEAQDEFLGEEELVVSVKQLDTWTDNEQLDLGQSHLLILARIYFQDFVWSGRKEAQPGRGRGQQQVEKEGEGKSKEASVKRGRKKPSFAIVVSNNSGENETEAGNAPSAMAKGKRSRPPSKKVLVYLGIVKVYLEPVKSPRRLRLGRGNILGSDPSRGPSPAFASAADLDIAESLLCKLAIAWGRLALSSVIVHGVVYVKFTASLAFTEPFTYREIDYS